MGYKVIGKMDERWEPRAGLEGPFQYLNGQVLYYDPKDNILTKNLSADLHEKHLKKMVSEKLGIYL